MAHVPLKGGGLLKVGGIDRPAILPIQTRFGMGAIRKVALIGTASTVYQAPWHDPSWEIWAHASACNLVPQDRISRWIDLHPKHKWQARKRWHADYQGWLKTLRTPIWMQQRYTNVPASVKFPRERLVAEFGHYFTSQAAWMIAAALTEGVTHLGLWGIHYQDSKEYRTQRPGCEWMLGVAFGRGVSLVLPPQCPLLKTPPWEYGYESHPEPAQASEATPAPEPAARLSEDAQIVPSALVTERPTSQNPFAILREALAKHGETWSGAHELPVAEKDGGI